MYNHKSKSNVHLRRKNTKHLTLAVAGEGRQEPPLHRVADNPTETGGADEGYQTPGETGE